MGGSHGIESLAVPGCRTLVTRKYCSRNANLGIFDLPMDIYALGMVIFEIFLFRFAVYEVPCAEGGGLIPRSIEALCYLCLEPEDADRIDINRLFSLLLDEL
jgi:hypothetical protein